MWCDVRAIERKWARDNGSEAHGKSRSPLSKPTGRVPVHDYLDDMKP